MIDTASRDAIRHTLHCLTGCSIGEIVGSAIGQHLNWPNIFQTALAIALAFVFGYSLTFRGARKMGLAPREAMKTALSTDTISIVSMEVVDNTLEWIIPGAMNAGVITWLFWWSNALSLIGAFLITVPVNRFVMTNFHIGHMHEMHEKS